MRNVFADELTQLAADDPRVVLLSGDIGNRLFNRYKESFADRFINCGIAEQNMISLAAGMAMSGLRPIAYTIAPFITARCLEQIKVDLCYHRQPVIVVGVGAGLSYANLGATHYGIDDLAMLRPLPNMTILCPGDPLEVRAALRVALQSDGPVYLRLGKKGEPCVHADVPDVTIGRGLTLHEGDDVCLLSVGTMLPVAMQVAQQLGAQGVDTRVVSMHTVKPMDDSLVAGVMSRCRIVATVEEHAVIGGFGSAVAEWLVDQPERHRFTATLLRIGCDDAYLCEAGDQAHARQHYGLTADAITQRVLDAWHRQASPVSLANSHRVAS